MAIASAKKSKMKKESDEIVIETKPHMNLHAIEKFKALKGVDFEDDVEFTVKGKVVSVSKGEFGSSMGIDITDIQKS